MSCAEANSIRGAIIAKPSQTFKKRQREIKLREKAQLKRERRRQRTLDKTQPPADESFDAQQIPSEDLEREAG